MGMIELGPNRYICDVFKEMRTTLDLLAGDKPRNTYSNEFIARFYVYFSCMVEEAQTMANRMEAALEDWKDVEHLKDERSRLKKEIKNLRAEKEKLENGNV